MPGLVPGIHVLRAAGKVVDGRDKPGQDVEERPVRILERPYAIALPNEGRGPPHLALPVGQNTRCVGQSATSKIFHFTEIRKSRMHRLDPARGRGAYRDRHETRAGRRWTQVSSARSRSRRAGNRERGAPRTASGEMCVRRNRVVPAPAGWRQAGAVMRYVQPGRRIERGRSSDGGNSASLPEKSAT